MRSHQNIILYRERAANAWNTPSKIANTFVNRFMIDEDFACEIVGIYELPNDGVDNFGVVHNSLIRIGYLKNIHFIFACNYLSLEKMIGNLIVDWTRRSKKKDVMVTLLTMTRLNLVTKELMMEIIQNRG